MALNHDECCQSRKKRANTDIGSDIGWGNVDIDGKYAFGGTAHLCCTESIRPPHCRSHSSSSAHTHTFLVQNHPPDMTPDATAVQGFI